MENITTKRTLNKAEKTHMDVADLILVAVLLAAGAVLKFFVGQLVNIGGMKPNFIIAMYCLAIMLIRPRIREAAVIGVLAGAICQLFPGTPYLNLISELLGALAMAMLVKIPMRAGKVDLAPAVCSFISTTISGGAFVVCLTLTIRAAAETLYAYVPIVLGTAAINAVIVTALYLPLRKALKK